MRYIKRHRTGLAQKWRVDSLYGEDDDPMSGVSNLFDIGLVFIVGLVLVLFGAYKLQDMLEVASSVSIEAPKGKDQSLERMLEQGKMIKNLKITQEKLKGRGERLGVAYRLRDGSMVYVPESGSGE